MVIAAGRRIVYYYREKTLLTPRDRKGVFYLDPFTYILLSILSCYRSCIKTGKTAPGGRPRDNSAEQSVIHLYTKCRKWRAERRALKKNLRNEAGIRWQRRPEKKWLAELLADRHAVGPLLEFLKSTQVGSREGEAEKEEEWERRRNRDGEDQLG